MDYWALGHIHRFQVLRKSEPAIVYSGNSQARHMRETGEKGCCLVTLSQIAPPVIKFIATDVVRFVQDEVDLSGTISLEEVIHAARAKCENFADQVKEREIYFNLLLTGRTQVHAELKRKTVLEDLQEEIGTYFKGRIPSIWVNLKLNTLGVYDIDSLRQGKDFIADLINLFEIEGKADSFPELEELIKPMFENWQGKKYLKSLTNQEMKDVLIQAKSLCLDKLLRLF
jgi:DNA repair exonuclease SbcCD nuclease subunit